MTDETLRCVSTCFLACVPVVEVRKLLDTVPRELLTEEFQELLIGCTILHPTATAFPPRTVYIRNFLKCLINKLEADNIEIADSLYVHFAGKLGSVSGEEDVPGFVTYTIDDRTMVTLKEHTAVVINGTTGLRTWQASKFLSEWCLENRDLLRSKRIVELGCGVGLTGMVVCKTCCPLSYTFTDGHEAVLQSVEENLRRNSVTGCHARVEMLRWGDHENFREHCTADVILGADLVFDPAVVPALVATLAALLAHGGTAYIASTVRNHETRALFLSKLADEASLQYEPCTAPREKIFFYDRSCPVEIEKVTACPRNSKQV
ncbi:protein-lysine N-methyltransferase EEF2KMT isoform X3 [Dermacentor variabilis]|uniref:protein-lysine N-methyltransferase EEF2KMT isoform X3 n=1 Tax=Dermacentor variabilis TaxID=34621 RepID=UPI003F5BD23F